jgi:TolA-binding protein
VGKIAVNIMRPITAIAAAATIALVPAAPSVAQRQQATPEQRIDRLERQVDDMQRRVYPKGRPAATAGFPDDPAATQASVISLDQRLDALERQMTDLVRQSEDNGNRTRTLESTIQQMRADADQRMTALEQKVAAGVVAAPVIDSGPASVPVTTPARPKPGSGAAKPATGTSKPSTGSAAATDAGSSAVAATDPAEEAYSEGFRLWEAGQYDPAIASLRAFVSAYPKHRRTSYANNLIGRALLDKGQAREAATALLANYRSNPGGERAQDSLYYLGQALTQLGQRQQACKAYAELDAVYGAKIRPDVRKLETDAKAQANCS